MQFFNLSGFEAWITTSLHLDRLSDFSVLALGIAFGLLAKNLYTIAMRSFGFVGSFASRLALGWWEEYRRETPNAVDFAMAVVSEHDGRQMLLMDPLVGPKRLNDIYLNPRTAFGVRMQTFSITRDRPWVAFRIDARPSLPARFRRWRRSLFRPAAAANLSPRERWKLKYRRVYAPIENLLGQYLTNQWAAQMAIGEPCHVFRFVVVLVYEKNADTHVDRQFHVIVVWDRALRDLAVGKVVTYQPELAHRWDTIRRIAEHYTSSPEAEEEFGHLHIMIPKRNLLNAYEVRWTEGPGGLVPLSRSFCVGDDPMRLLTQVGHSLTPAPDGGTTGAGSG